jgi:lactate dehydrogenase-like 2-hydroxyacid dehydrogenase
MKDLIVLVGSGSIGQAIARRAGAMWASFLYWRYSVLKRASQSTTNSRAPVSVRDRWGSALSATW